MVFELIGKPDKIDAFLKMFEDYEILEQMCIRDSQRADNVDVDVIRAPLGGGHAGQAADALLGGSVGALADVYKRQPWAWPTASRPCRPSVPSPT